MPNTVVKIAEPFENVLMQQTHGELCQCADCATTRALQAIPGSHHWPINRLCACNYCIDKNYPEGDVVVARTFPRHPTLLEIAQRQQEIDQWAEPPRGHSAERWTKALLAGGGSALAMGLVLPWGASVYASVIGVMLVSAGGFCGKIWVTNERHRSLDHLRPEALFLVPFLPEENRHLLGSQESEPFRALGACPGCGDVGVHRLRDPQSGDPQWATVVRQCGECRREWAQR